MKPAHDDSARELLAVLWRELFQTETSAARHCRREAARLGDASPAAPLVATAKAADRALGQLADLSARHGLPEGGAGSGVGAAFSALRELALDRLLDEERSYRATLLGMRHGVDVVRLVGHVADEIALSEISVWCDEWLEERLPLLEAAEEELAWFARNARRAVQRARPLFGTRA